MANFQSKTWISGPKPDMSRPYCDRKHVDDSQIERDGFLAARDAFYASLPSVAAIETEIERIGLVKRDKDLRISEIKHSGSSAFNELSQLKRQIWSLENKLAELKKTKRTDIVSAAIRLWEENKRLSYEIAQAKADRLTRG